MQYVYKVEDFIGDLSITMGNKRPMRGRKDLSTARFRLFSTIFSKPNKTL